MTEMLTIPDHIQLTDISTTGVSTEDNRFELSESVEYQFTYLGIEYKTIIPDSIWYEERWY